MSTTNTCFYLGSVRCINNNKSRVIEGILRCKDLSDFLDSHNTKKSVWISEDATAVISEYRYDPMTNQIIGIVLPLNKNGSPIPFRYFSLDSC